MDENRGTSPEGGLPTRSSDSLDGVVRLLANRDYRFLVAFLRNHPNEPVPIEVLAHEFQNSTTPHLGGNSRDIQSIKLQLYHRCLPKLSEFEGIAVDYDGGAVLYRPNPVLEEFLDFLTEFQEDYFDG